MGLIYGDELDARTLQGTDGVLIYDASGNAYFCARTALLTNLDTDSLAEGASNAYWTNTRFDNRLATKTLDDIADGNAAIRALYRHTEVDHNQILTLNSLPIDLISSGAANLVLVLVGLVLDYTYGGTAPYASNNILIRDSSTGNTLITVPSSILTTSASDVQVVSLGNTPISIAANSSIEITVDSADPSAGDAGNVLDVWLIYFLLDIS